MTETDSDITRSYRGYNAGTRDYDSITRNYRREKRELEEGVIRGSYKRERGREKRELEQ